MLGLGGFDISGGMCLRNIGFGWFVICDGGGLV